MVKTNFFVIIVLSLFFLQRETGEQRLLMVREFILTNQIFSFRYGDCC